VLLPLFGFGFCTLIWWNLNIVAKIAGGVWFLAGLIYIVISTRGFSVKPVTIHFDES
jgi:putrescine importer